MANEIEKLGYVRATPRLAFARVAPSGLSSDIYKNQAGDAWIVASNFSIPFDGIDWGAIQPLPGPGGTTDRPAIIANYAFDPGSGRRLYIGGDVSSQNPSAIGPDPHWSGNYPIYAMLMRGNIIVNGEVVAEDLKAVWLVEGWQDMGNDGQDIKALRDLVDLGVITPFPEMEIQITDVRAIFRMFDNVDGNQEQHGGGTTLYSHDWATQPTDDWGNEFLGSGFGIDVLDSKKASHAEPGYTLDGGAAGSFAKKTVVSGKDSGYQQNARTYFTGSPNPMLDLRIDNAESVRNGGVLKIGYNANVVCEIIGGQNNFGVNYGMAGEDLSQLKTQLVTILSNASQPGQPLNGLLTFVSPSSDNLPSWVQN